MSFNPNDSAIRIDAALEEKLKSATFEEIKEHLKTAAVAQNLVTRDIFSPDVLLPTELASAAPKKIGKVVRLNGVTHSLVADDEAGLLAQETALYRAILAQPDETTRQTAEQPRNERGQFVAAEDAVTKAELELRFKRGELSADEYLMQSGAIERHLEAQGVDMASLKEVSNQHFAQSWADCTQQFLQGVGADYPGGEANKQKMGEVLIAMGAMDSPSVENLARAYRYLRENNLLVENPDITYAREIQAARSAEEIASVNHRYFGTGMFDR